MINLTKIPQDCTDYDNYINIILIKYTGRHNTILSMILHVIEFLKIKTDLLDPRIWAQILLRPRSRSTQSRIRRIQKIGPKSVLSIAISTPDSHFTFFLYSPSSPSPTHHHHLHSFTIVTSFSGHSTRTSRQAGIQPSTVGMLNASI